MLSQAYFGVDSDYFQPIRGQLHSSAEISADMRLCGDQVGGQSQ